MKTRQIFIVLLSLIFVELLIGQGRIYEGPIDPAGDQAALRENHMSGNRFRLYFNNQGRLGHYPFIDGSKFPANSPYGLDLFDSNVLIIGAKVYLVQDSIPVTDLTQVRSRGAGELDSLYYCLSGRTDHAIDMSPDGNVEWGMQPVFGYFNVSSESPGVSTDPNSWPREGWPSTGLERKWQGMWNGRFGPFPYAHMESYSVLNDAQDQENLQPGNRVTYSPRGISNVRIGDQRPEVTTQYGLPWGGVGTRVAMRGYQWNNPQTRDIIFWEYDVTNISDYNLPQVVFGFYMDMGIGTFMGRLDEDAVASFNEELELSFAWDINGVGFAGYATGTLGYAFLESPGIPNDGLDNDEDGLIDEKRDNAAVQQIGARDGINDLSRFLEAYGMAEEDLEEHWDADEDQDWQDGDDVNGNGTYDSGELAHDDVGLDGISPAEVNYPGPDPDGTECNHKPDYMEGINAEPNFAITDVSESDMLGLSSFHLFPHPQDGSPWVKYDEDCYNRLADQQLDDSYANPANLFQSFASGPFSLPKGRTERISMAMIVAFENLSVLNNQNEAPIIYERKKVVQIIYESDYRFARPPILPKLSASAGDGQVILTWDAVSDQKTAEVLLNGANDFEGYRLYKATDIAFSDAQTLRDGYGNPGGNFPYFQCDLDDAYAGFTDYALVEGVGYFLGNNTGIQHYFVDNEVENGKTYYYYLTAYDYGIESSNIAPSENVATVVVDEEENVTFMTPNVQFVTPRPPVNDFVASGIEILTDPEGLWGSGNVKVEVAEPHRIKGGHTYLLKFDMDTLSAEPKIPEDVDFRNDGFRIYDMTESGRLVYEENPKHFVGTNILPSLITESYFFLNNQQGVLTDIFDGLQVSMNDLVTEAEWDSLGSSWIQGYGQMNIAVNTERIVEFPWQYDIVFTDVADIYTSQYSGRSITNLEGALIREYFAGESFPFYVENKMFFDQETGSFRKCEIVAVDKNENEIFELMEDEMYVGYSWIRNEREYWIRTLFRIDFNGISEQDMPKAGDVYRVDCIRAFVPSDSIVFKVVSPQDKGLVTEENLDKIRVVPNPYIMTNSMEPAVRNNTLNQRRRLMFKHIPSRCTIKIFTMSGYLVDTIHVENNDDNGIVHWDLLTKENLEIAAGVYLYHLKSHATGKEKLGKFAVVK